MVQTLFFIHYKSQLRRTRPELIRRLDSAMNEAARNTGGKITDGRQCFRAVFDEQSLGFWLEILLLLETMQAALKEEAPELHGYALLVGKDLPEKSEPLCRSLAAGPQGGGIYLDPAAREALAPYITFEQVQVWPGENRQKNLIYTLAGLTGFKAFPSGQNFPQRETIVAAIGQKPRHNALIVGPAWSGKRDGVHQYSRKVIQGFPPLVIRFSAGGLSAFVDAWSTQIQSFVSGARRNAEDTAELNDLWDYLFRERLRQELSPFVLQKGRYFLSRLLETYTALMKQKGALPIIILENIHQAEKEIAQIFIETFINMKNKVDVLVLGTCALADLSGADLQQWEEVFPRVIKLKIENGNLPPEIPVELWEMSYALSLLSGCFPASLFLQLFEEEGKNPAVVTRAISILLSLGIIDTPMDPRPRIENFTARAESILGNRKEMVRVFVRKRLLSWVERKKLTPCFRLLSTLFDLDQKENLADELILKSIYADLAAGTTKDIENAIATGFFEAIIGPERAAAILNIYQAMRALHYGNEDNIKAAFLVPPPECAAYPVLKAQTLVNMASAFLGQRDIPPAMETIKEAIMISQKKNNFCLPQSYRLFSLVNLFKRQASETHEYLNFAMENAEKSGNYHELGVSTYYAAASQFLFGNLSRVERLTHNARVQALAAGSPDWADRAQFLEGRLAFEIGAYRQALEIFEALLKKPLGVSSAEKCEMLSAWAYRAAVFARDPKIPKPSSGGYDADLFEIEAAYLAGNYEKTIELAGALGNPHIEKNFLFTEQPDWRSGFAQCEHLYFSQGEVWDRIVSTYQSLALCKISAEGGEEALQNMQRILRDEKLAEMDPWDAFYFYAWYHILEHTGAGQVDMNTAISMAFKRLQRRASRIDDNEIRRQFLSIPRWNGALSRAAKEFKLI